MARLKMARSCLTVLVLSAVVEKIGVHATGVFELDLLSFKNDGGLLASGECCRGPTVSGQCSGSCSTHFRICFKHFTRELTDASDCTYGEYATGVVGNNTFDFPREQGNFSSPIVFPFRFAWRGDFSLIVEAYDQTAEEGSDRLIYRMARADSASPSSDWMFSQATAGSMALSYRVKVACDETYYGTGCNDQCVPRDEFDGHWNCTDSGKRQCLPGWTGVYCDKPICLEGCDPTNGYCERPNECSCKTGYEGKLCNQCVPYPGCDKGFCRKPFECICQEGWGGIFCNQDLNYCTHHRPCQNGGTCSNTGHGSYTCTCTASFSGTNCEVALDPGVAHGDSFYCQNGGIYFMTSSGEPSCDCPQKFTGSNCEVAVTGCEQSPCKNGATCEPAGQSYRCRCAPGWTGAKCQQNRDDCSSNPCQNSGKCIDKINGFECVCPPGFNGSLCEMTKDSCTASPCLNGGLCKSDGTGGFRCDCASGYIGTRCQVDIDECAVSPCANGGRCHDLVNDFRCECPAGYGGRLCDEQLNDCLSAPCANGGKCSDLLNDYACVCPPPWEGKNCDQQQQQQLPLQLLRSPASSAGAVTPVASQQLPVAGQVESAELSTAAQAHFSKEEMVLIVALGSGVPLLLLLVLACLLVYRRQRSLRKQQRQAGGTGGGDGGRAEAGLASAGCGIGAAVEASRKAAYYDDCALEKNQNVVNSMNNRQLGAGEHKQAAEGSKYVSVKLGNALDDTSASAMAASISTSEGRQPKPSYYSVNRLGKVTNKDLLKSFAVDRRNVDYLTLYLADEQLPSSDLFNAELLCSVRSEPMPEPVTAGTQQVLTVPDKQCLDREPVSSPAMASSSSSSQVATPAGASAVAV